MKLFTKDNDKKLFAQYPKGSDLESQMVVAKIFNPYGRGTWYILNSDPEDSDYLWAIVDLFEVEIGSVSRSEIENIKVPPFRLGLERDTSFQPINAKVLYDSLIGGKKFAKGGEIGEVENGVQLSEDKHGQHYLFPADPKSSTKGILLEKGGSIFTIEAYDDEKHSSVRAYLKELVTNIFGKENSYSGSADWGGMPVWTIKGDKFYGVFILIDDNASLVLMTRKTDGDEDNYDDEDLMTAEYDNVDEIKELLEEAKSIQGKKMEKRDTIKNNTNLPKVGSKVYGRWNDTMQWTTGIFKGETEKGFEVYDFSIEQPKYIEYYGQISLNPHYNGYEFFKSNKFKDRNYQNYHFNKQNTEYEQGGSIGFIPMALEHTLSLVAKRGVVSVKQVIGILNAIVDSGLTDEDVQPIFPKTTSSYNELRDKKTEAVWKIIKNKYTGDLIGNKYFQTLLEIVKQDTLTKGIIAQFKPFRKMQKFENGGSIKKGWKHKK